MDFKTASAKYNSGDAIDNAKKAVAKLKTDFAGFSPALVIYFAATDYDPSTIAEAMAEAFPDITTIGCTSAGEARDDVMLQGSVVAMGYSRSVFDFQATALVVDGYQGGDAANVFATAEDAMNYLGERAGASMLALSYKKYVGLILASGISQFSENLLEKVGELSDVLFIGGFAGDDYKFETPSVFFNGRVYRPAAVIALWKPRKGFSLLKTQAVDFTGTSFRITRADEERRIIWEFDGKPAAEVYAEAIGVPVAAMNIMDFDENPLALKVDGEPYLRAVVKQVDGKGLFMFASVKEGTQLALTKNGNLVATTAAALAGKRSEMGHIAALLHLNCASRHTLLANRGRTEEFGKLFAGIPNIGMSSYGEIYVGIVAMTSTMILFK